MKMAILKFKNAKMPKISTLSLYMFLVALPVEVNDSLSVESGTKVRIYGGRGDYAYITRGCEGQVLGKQKVPFTEFGSSIEHKFQNIPIRIGVGGSHILTRAVIEDFNSGRRFSTFTIDSTISRNIINPYINLEYKYIALGTGYHSHDPIPFGSDDISSGRSTYLRIGNRNTKFLSGSWFHTAPYLSTGYFKFGLTTVRNDGDLWLGFALGPYEGPFFVAHYKRQLDPRLSIDVLGGFGESEGIIENSISFGTSYTF